MFEQSEQSTKNFGLTLYQNLLIFLYPEQHVEWENNLDTTQAHHLISASGLHNYLCCRIQVQSGLNIKV